jgi:hypothetical protein
MKWVRSKFTPDGQLIVDPMIGTYENKPVGSPMWAEAMACHIQHSHERMVRNGSPNYLCQVIRDALAASPHPWEVYPEEAKGDPEAWMRMVTGKPLAEVLSYVRRIDAKAGQELMELLALKLSAEQMEVVEAGLWFDLGEDPEALARAIRRQFPVEQRRELVRALQSPDLRVSRQEADRLRKRALRGTDLAARACEHCGKVFEPKRSQARFCGGSCRAKASQERKEAPATPAKRQFIEVDAKKESAAAVEPAVVEPEVSAAVEVLEREVPKGPARQRYSYSREGLELLEADLVIYGQERLCELLGVKTSTLKGYHGRLKHFKDWEPPVEGPKRRWRNIDAAEVLG